MNIKRSLLVAGAVTSVGLAGAGVSQAGAAFAATDSTTGSGSTSIVDKLATKFKLNKSDVQAVFDADRSEHEAARQAETEKTLTQAVTDGKLTETQKTAILAKQKELKGTMEANRTSMQSKTPAERKAAMDANRTALQSWATANNIPQEYMRYVMGGGHGGPGGPGGHGDMMPPEAPAASTN